MILVSIIVPVYNAEDYLVRCLDSLTRQTLENIEIILVDDGSTDSSGAIIDEYLERDERITVVHVDNNGPARARNIGIDNANGEYLGFVDSDDYVDEDMFRQLFDATQGVDLAMCNYHIVQDGKDVVCKMEYPTRLNDHKQIRNDLIQRYYTGDNRGLYCLWNKLFRRAIIQKERIRIDERLRRAEDAWFVYNVLRYIDSFAYINSPLYFYIQNSNSIMHAVLPGQYERWKETRQRLIIDNQEYGFNLELNQFYESMLYKLAVYCRDLANSGDTNKVKEILTDSFYKEISRYSKNLPIHIRLLHLIGRNNPQIAFLLYIIWGKI